MALTKLERIEREIEKTRSKITEYQTSSKSWNPSAPNRKTLRLWALCAPCA